MLLLIGVGFLAGLIIGISPCIVPVIPVVLATGAMSDDRRRPYWVLAGLISVFTVVTLVGSELLSLLHLPQSFLYYAGLVFLIALGVGLVIPGVGEWLERPFTRMQAKGPVTGAGGFVFGASLGLVFLPCAGPVYATITTLASAHRVGPTVVFMTLAYALGAAIPLLVLAEASRKAMNLFKAIKSHLQVVRVGAGALMVGSGIAIWVGLFTPLQTSVPGYTSSLQSHIENSTSVHEHLESLKRQHGSTKGNAPATMGADLMDYGSAPNFAGITAWLNTPGDLPLSISSLKGKVVLVDFWTYSCINCRRSLPHVEAWYRTYHSYGLDVVGVSTPEFAFEHVVSNVKSAAEQLGVDYPVAIDDNYDTWNAYDNEYWPAEYLIDQQGVIRHEEFGEGDYGGTETAIRALLEAGGAKDLPPATDVANRTPTGSLSEETYVGYDRLQDESFAAEPELQINAAANYQLPPESDLSLGTLAFGGKWTVHSEEATAGKGAVLELGYEAADVYLVMSGTGTIQVSNDGRHTQDVRVSGVPGLYTIVGMPSEKQGFLKMSFSPGLEAYDFTFG